MNCVGGVDFFGGTKNTHYIGSELGDMCSMGSNIYMG